MARYDGRGFRMSDWAVGFSLEARVGDLESILAAAGGCWVTATCIDPPGILRSAEYGSQSE